MGIRVQWVLDYSNPHYLYPDIRTSADVAKFSVPAGKIRFGHWSFLQEKARLLYERSS